MDRKCRDCAYFKDIFSHMTDEEILDYAQQETDEDL